MRRLVVLFPAALLLGLLVLPIVALVVGLSPADLEVGLRHPLVLPALGLSLVTSLVALVVVVALGTPLAWLLAQRERRVIEILVELPVVLPPAVLGVALLLAFGRHGLLGPFLERAGLSVAFTPAAVVLAQIVVAAPFYVLAATSAFRALDRELLVVARTLGASPARAFFRVALPITRPALLRGATLAWARALGEFGATLLFAGSLAGRTMTWPLAIYAALESDLRAARAIALVLVVVAFALLFAVRKRSRERRS
jgi:molybdate transport system permease protein